ncbi:hypothetical protein PR048_026941 [Dryococelus australis]|uniref:Uncharacterized protein n=1 Tax=Dryococelus australis TaxID=614101 RepID=A0ABQ9GMS6_9NEOP|nr:hypothetical protein PR048_026941 [Dryococelus australis]
MAGLLLPADFATRAGTLHGGQDTLEDARSGWSDPPQAFKSAQFTENSPYHLSLRDRGEAVQAALTFTSYRYLHDRQYELWKARCKMPTFQARGTISQQRSGPDAGLTSLKNFIALHILASKAHRTYNDDHSTDRPVLYLASVDQSDSHLYTRFCCTRSNIPHVLRLSLIQARGVLSSPSVDCCTDIPHSLNDAAWISGEYATLLRAGTWHLQHSIEGQRGKRDIPEKTRRPAASSCRIPTCENLGATAPGIEPSSLKWKASCLVTTSPRPPFFLVKCKYIFYIVTAERLACSPPTTVNRVQSLAGHSRIFTRGSRDGRCRWLAGFLGDLPFHPPFNTGAAPYSLQSSSLALETSLVRVPTDARRTWHGWRARHDERHAGHDGQHSWHVRHSRNVRRVEHDAGCHGIPSEDHEYDDTDDAKTIVQHGLNPQFKPLASMIYVLLTLQTSSNQPPVSFQQAFSQTTSDPPASLQPTHRSKNLSPDCLNGFTLVMPRAACCYGYGGRTTICWSILPRRRLDVVDTELDSSASLHTWWFTNYSVCLQTAPAA